VPLTLTVADGFGLSSTYHLYVEVQFLAKPAITSPASTTFTAGTLGYFKVTASGAPTPSLSLASGKLPAGFGFEPSDNGTAVITGNASTVESGVYSLGLQATNSQGTATQTFTLTIDAAPAITSPSSARLTAGLNGSVTFAASGYPRQILSYQGTLPSAMTFTAHSNGTATLSGVPPASAVGTYPLTLTATSAEGTASQQFNLVVSTAPSITSPSDAYFVTEGSPASFAITTTGSPAPSLSESGSLPSGLAFHDNGNGTAEIYGATKATGTYPITITASNGTLPTVTQSVYVIASASGGPLLGFSGPNFTSASGEALFQEGTAGSLTITSSPAAAITLPAGTHLPAGLQFTPGTGQATISGTPQAGTDGYYGLEVQAAGGGRAFLTLVVYGAPAVTSAHTTTFTTGVPGTFTITTAGVPVAALSESGALPPNLKFSSSGNGTATISGTPTGAGAQYAVTIKAQNALSTATFPLTIVVDQAPAITSPASGGLGEGIAGSIAITTSGFPSPTLSEAGTLPPGVQFKAGANGTATLSGIPTGTTPGTYPITITATSAAGVATQSFALHVGPVPTIVSTPGATFSVGQPGSFTVRTFGLPTPTLAETGALPADLTFSANRTAPRPSRAHRPLAPAACRPCR
jgi:hypothetical protein